MSTRKLILTLGLLALVVAGGVKWAGRGGGAVLDPAPVPSVEPDRDPPPEEGIARSGERLRDAQAQLIAAEQRLASAAARISQLEDQVRSMETVGPTSRTPGRVVFPDESWEATDVSMATNEVRRSWGPEQAAGAPDTFAAGDISTAWASRVPDGGEEWLKLVYERAVEVAEVHVRETYNPGAVVKVTALTGGSEQVLWEGEEPHAPAPNDVTFTVPPGIRASSIKVYLDTRRVPGWNEIDAVELVGRDGSRQWARRATASSTYAER